MVNIYVCDYTDSEGINTIIAIQQESHEEYIDTLIEDLGYDSVAYAFRCICCNKVTIVCQNY